MAGVLAGQIALIAGGSAGIGRAAVELFAGEGATVVFAARHAKRAEDLAHAMRRQDRPVVFVQADVSRPTEVKALVSRTIDHFGRIDCAFNNAAALGPLRRLADYTEADFDSEVTSNLKSIWLCMKHEIEQMKKQTPPGGSIVNVSSVNGLGGAPGASLYAMAKAGVLGLTKSAAQEYAADGIRVNALVAGGFDTDMLRNAVTQMAGDDPARVEEAFKGYTGRVPLGRIGHPREAAQAALWLCSKAASYVTGLGMIVDGGMTSWAR